MEQKTSIFPIYATFFCFMGFVLLCTMGIWQVKRLAWKNDLQAQLSAQFSIADDDLKYLQPSDLMYADKLMRGVVDLELYPSKALFLNGYVRDGRTQYPVIMPARMVGTDQYLAVVVGVMPSKETGLWSDQPSFSAELRGAIKRSDTVLFRPDNDSANNDWWTIDPIQMASSWGVSQISPNIFYAQNAADLIEGVSPYVLDVTLRNNHLQYAIFWFVMAGIMVVLWWIRFIRPYLQSA